MSAVDICRRVIDVPDAVRLCRPVGLPDAVQPCRPVAVVHPQRRCSTAAENHGTQSALTESRVLPTIGTEEVQTSQLEESSTRHLQVTDRRRISSSSDEDYPSLEHVAEADVNYVASMLSNSERVELTELSYYHGRVSSSEAKRLLSAEPVGTFLLRDSQSRNANFPFAISVAVKSGGRNGSQVTSVRIARCNLTGQYRLDCAENQIGDMPLFHSVKTLVEYFVTSSSISAGDVAPSQPQQRRKCILIDSHGRNEQRLTLRVPLSATTREH